MKEFGVALNILGLRGL
jgi:hypothetical protein